MGEEVKTNYSQEVIDILNDKKVKELIKDAHSIRKIFFERLKEVSDIEIIICALQMYCRKKQYRNQFKKKKELKLKGGEICQAI